MVASNIHYGLAIAKGISEERVSQFFQFWLFSKVMEYERWKIHLSFNTHSETNDFESWTEQKLEKMWWPSFRNDLSSTLNFVKFEGHRSMNFDRSSVWKHWYFFSFLPKESDTWLWYNVFIIRRPFRKYILYIDLIVKKNRVGEILIHRTEIHKLP